MEQAFGHAGRVFDLAWHPTEPLLASASEDGSVRIWRAQTGGGWTQVCIV